MSAVAGEKADRPWECHWERFEPVDFLRTDEQFNHPSRFIIADEAAKIGGTILECGSATCIDYPIHSAKGLLYFAIDITPKFIARAKELYPGINARVASILDLPFPDASCDTVYCRAVLEHLHPKEWVLAIKEMWRVAKKQMIVCLYRKPSKTHLSEDGKAINLPASFVVKNPRDQIEKHKSASKTVDLKVEFKVGGKDEPRPEKRVVFAAPIPEHELLELLRNLQYAGPVRYLETSSKRHTIHYLYIVPKLM